jgi:hypothetical protein
MRSGGKGMWGRGPALYKHNSLKKKKNKQLPLSAAYLGLVSDPETELKKQHYPKARPSIFHGADYIRILDFFSYSRTLTKNLRFWLDK